MKTNKLTSKLFGVLLLLPFSTVHADRPSLTSLQQQINQLQAQLAQQPRQPVLIDANGQKIGDVLGVVPKDAITDWSEYSAVGAVFVAIKTAEGLTANVIYDIQYQRFEGPVAYFDASRCTGNVVGIEPSVGLLTLSHAKNIPGGVGGPVSGAVIHVPDTTSPPVTVSAASVETPGSCASSTGGSVEFTAYPLRYEIDLSGPFVQPFRVEVVP